MGIHTILFNIFAIIAITSACGVIISKNPIYSLALLIVTFRNATGLLILFKIELLAMMFIIIYVGAIAVSFLFVVMMLNIKSGVNKEQIKEPFGLNGLDEKTNHFEQIKQENQEKIIKIKGKLTEKIIKFSIIISVLILTLCNTHKNVQNKIGINQVYEIINQDNKLENIKQLNLIWDEFYLISEAEKPWNSIIETVTNIQALGNVMYTYYFYYFIMAGMILLIAMIGAIVLTMYKRKNAWKKQIIYKQIARNFESTITKVT